MRVPGCNEVEEGPDSAAANGDFGTCFDRFPNMVGLSRRLCANMTVPTKVASQGHHPGSQELQLSHSAHHLWECSVLVASLSIPYPTTRAPTAASVFELRIVSPARPFTPWTALFAPWRPIHSTRPMARTINSADAISLRLVATQSLSSTRSSRRAGGRKVES